MPLIFFFDRAKLWILFLQTLQFSCVWSVLPSLMINSRLSAPVFSTIGCHCDTTFSIFSSSLYAGITMISRSCFCSVILLMLSSILPFSYPPDSFPLIFLPIIIERAPSVKSNDSKKEIFRHAAIRSLSSVIPYVSVLSGIFAFSPVCSQIVPCTFS